MSLLNNFNLSNNFNSLAPTNTTFNNIDSKKFKDSASIKELTLLLSKGESTGLSETEYANLINILKMFNIEIDPEIESVKSDKMPSILSSTEAYIKVFKALMEVLAKLKEEEERNLKKIRQEEQMLIHEQKIEKIQKDMIKASELLKSKENEAEDDVDTNFNEIEEFFQYIGKEYNLNIENTRKNPIDIVI